MAIALFLLVIFMMAREGLGGGGAPPNWWLNGKAKELTISLAEYKTLMTGENKEKHVFL